MISEKRVKKYCRESAELIENYELAMEDSEVWDCHHRLELEYEDGTERKTPLTSDELKEQGMYFGRPASELIFLPHSEHIALHGKYITPERRRKISAAISGEKNYWFGKHLPQEVKDKISAANMNKTASEETKYKMSLKKRGINNPSAKLEELKRFVNEFLDSDLTNTEIGELLGVERHTIGRWRKLFY